MAEKCDSGRFWVIWGFLISFFGWKLYFLGFCGFSKIITGSTGIRTRDIHCEKPTSCRCTTYTTTRFSEVKPGQTHLLLGTKPVFYNFLPLGGWLAKTQNGKMLRNFWEIFGGRANFPPKSAPSSGKLCFSVFGPELLKVPRGCPRPKGPKKPVSRFPAPGGPGSQNATCRKVADNHPG